MPKEHIYPLGKCSYWLDVLYNPGNVAVYNERKSRIAQRLLAKMWQFPSLFSEVLIPVYNYEKSKERGEIIKTLYDTSPIFALSDSTIFGQSQSRVTIL
jgi:hypothetical protein